VLTPALEAGRPTPPWLRTAGSGVLLDGLPVATAGPSAIAQGIIQANSCRLPRPSPGRQADGGTSCIPSALAGGGTIVTAAALATLNQPPGDNQTSEEDTDAPVARRISTSQRGKPRALKQSAAKKRKAGVGSPAVGSSDSVGKKQRPGRKRCHQASRFRAFLTTCAVLLRDLPSGSGGWGGFVCSIFENCETQRCAGQLTSV
jgi:hypothetical protein